MADVKLIVQAVDKASKGLRDATTGLNKLEKAAGSAAIKHGVAAEKAAMLGKAQRYLSKRVIEGTLSAEKAADVYNRYSRVLDANVDTTSKAEKATKTLTGGLKSFAITAGVAMGAAVALGAASKKAFDFSREGAALNQLEESFDRMNTTVFRTPELLDKMTEAARGTIKETRLMAGVLTLTAGVTNEVAQQFAAAAPKLVEIAKASNKLNPTLGDTAFLFESLSLGIKRGSKLILDNLGLNISLGVAHKEYAKQLGKTVDELTEQERVLAVLYATMRQGDQLIRQVGGDVDALTDSYDKLTVAYGEAIEMAKKEIAMNDKAVAYMADSLDLRNKSIKAFKLLQAAYERGEISARKLDSAYKVMNADEALFLKQNKDLIDSLIQSEKGLDANSAVIKKNTALWEKQKEEIKDTVRIWAMADPALWALIWGQREFEFSVEDSTKALFEQNDAGLALLATELELTNVVKNYKAERLDEQLEAEKKAAEEEAKALEKIRDEMLSLAQSITSGNVSLGLFNEEFGELGKQLISVGGRTADQNRLLGIATDEYDKLGQKIADVSLYPALFGKSVDEASESIGGWIERQGELMPIMDELGNITGATATIIREATWDEDALTEALFHSAAEFSKTKEQALGYGVALGVMNEQQAAAILQQWMMYNTHLPALGEALAKGAISTNTAKEAMLLLAGGIVDTWQEAVALIGTVEELAGVLDELPLEKQIRIKLNVEYDKMPDWYDRGGDEVNWPGGGGVNNDNGTNEPGASTPRQLGGPVLPGQSYIVGEDGPEIFRPQSAGSIIPATGGGSGGLFRDPRSQIDISRGIKSGDVGSIADQLELHKYTVRQADQFLELDDAISRARENVHSYEIGVRGANLTDEERLEKIKELREEMGGFIDQQSKLEGSYDKVSDAIYNHNKAIEDEIALEDALKERARVLEEVRRFEQGVLRGTSGALGTEMGFMDMTLGGMTSQRNILSGRIGQGLGALGLMGKSQADIQAKIQQFKGQGGIGDIYAQELKGILEDMKARRTLENRIMDVQGQRMALAEQLNQINIQIDAGSGDEDMERRIEEAVLAALLKAGIKSTNTSRTRAG